MDKKLSLLEQDIQKILLEILTSQETALEFDINFTTETYKIHALSSEGNAKWYVLHGDEIIS